MILFGVRNVRRFFLKNLFMLEASKKQTIVVVLIVIMEFKKAQLYVITGIFLHISMYFFLKKV
jgi:hypothetical protein